jgi:hypothetical protein
VKGYGQVSDVGPCSIRDDKDATNVHSVGIRRDTHRLEIKKMPNVRGGNVGL